MTERFRARCAICRLQDEALAPVDVAGPGDELVLFVEVRRRAGAGLAVDLSIELDRGEQLRHRVCQRVDLSGGPACVALRLHWGRRAGASSRLTCRVALDGRPAGSAAVLLLPDRVDAQGRFSTAQTAPPSENTRLVYESAFQALLEGDGNEASKKERDSGVSRVGSAQAAAH